MYDAIHLVDLLILITDARDLHQADLADSTTRIQTFTLTYIHFILLKDSG